MKTTYTGSRKINAHKIIEQNKYNNSYSEIPNRNNNGLFALYHFSPVYESLPWNRIAKHALPWLVPLSTLVAEGIQTSFSKFSTWYPLKRSVTGKDTTT